MVKEFLSAAIQWAARLSGKLNLACTIFYSAHRCITGSPGASMSMRHRPSGFRESRQRGQPGNFITIDPPLTFKIERQLKLRRFSRDLWQQSPLSDALNERPGTVKMTIAR
jgi:hypothetical protein